MANALTPGAAETPAPAGGDEARRERFWRTLCERAVFVFALICMVFVLMAPQDRHLIPGRLALCLAPTAATALVAALQSRFPASWLLWTLRYFACLFFLPFFFRLTGQIAPLFPLGHFDDAIMAVDGLLLGDPRASLRFQEIWPHPLFGEFMCLAYLAYYLFLPFCGIVLVLTRLRRNPGPSADVAWYAACCALAYMLHYLAFFLFPVAGPAFHLAGGVARDPGYAASALHQFVVSAGDVPGGGFPSSHVSIALLHVFIAARFRRRGLCALAAAVTAAICAATVYTQAHYVADAMGGLASGALVWLLLAGIERARARRAPAEGQSAPSSPP